MNRVILVAALLFSLLFPMGMVKAAVTEAETALLAEVEGFLQQAQPAPARGRALYWKCAEIQGSYGRQSDYHAAIEWMLRRIALMEKITPTPTEDLGLDYDALANLYKLSKQYPLGIEAQRKATELFEAVQSPDVRWRLVYGYQEIAHDCSMSGRYDEAAQWLQKAISLAATMGEGSPVPPEELYEEMSQIYVRSKAFDRAALWKHKEIAVFQKNKKRSFERQYFDLYWIYAAKNDADAAEKWLKTAVKEAERIDNTSSLETYYNECSRFYQAQGKSAESAVWAKKTDDLRKKNLERSVKGVDRYVPDKAYANLEKGKLMSQKKSHTQAIDYFDQAIELKPDSVEAYYYRGMAYAALKNEVQAEKDFKQALDWSESVCDTSFNIAMFYQGEAEWEKSVAYYTKSIAAGPNPSQHAAYFNRANVYMRLREYKLAIADADCAIALRPRDHAAYEIKANAYLHLGNLADALESYTRAIEVAPTTFTAYATYIRRALIYYQLGKEKEAEADIEKACSLNKKKAEEMIEQIAESAKSISTKD